MASLTRQRLEALRMRHPDPPRVFVETGTYQGKTTRLALAQFDTVYTIELDAVLFEAAHRALAPLGALCYPGDSRFLIPVLAQQIRERVFWYLDAHWYQPATGIVVAGQEEGLPLWDELAAIAERPYADVVVVDDVHSFGRSAPTDEWLDVDLERIASRLGRHHEAVILGDQAVVYRSAEAAASVVAG